MTRSVRSCGLVTTSLCVVLTAAVAVTGKPHARAGCTSQDDYASALSAAYYLTGVAPRAAVEPPAALGTYEYGGQADDEVVPCRSGRSNDHGGPSTVDDAPPPLSLSPPSPAHHQPIHSVKLSAAALGPCKGPSPPPQQQQQLQHHVANETASSTATLTAEKLTAYYDRLKAHQEQLARHQLEMQLIEQQQRRQREYALVQQQIHQQYYQQQQHAMLMLDQLHKNPAFVSQMAAFMDQRIKANNGTAASAVPAVAAAAQVPVPAAAQVPVAAASVPVADAASVPVVTKPVKAVKDDVDEDEEDQEVRHGRSHAYNRHRQEIQDDDDDDDDDDHDDDHDKDHKVCGVPNKRVQRRPVDLKGGPFDFATNDRSEDDPNSEDKAMMNDSE